MENQVNMTGTTTSVSKKSKKRSETRVSTKAIEQLFMRFTVRYQDAWASKMKNKDWKQMMVNDWHECLSDLSIYQVKRGLDNLKRSKFKTFPPNCLEFHELCLTDFDFPTMHECYKAAVKGKWGFHPIVKPTADACDLYWLRRASESDGMERFSGYYKQMREKFLAGEKLVRTLEIDIRPEVVRKNWADIEIDKRIREMKGESYDSSN